VQNRKDLYQAHQLMTQRASLALICGEPDSPNQPLRRMNTAAICGIMAGVIAAAVFGVLGLLVPGPVSGLTHPGTLVVDEDTATPYVPCEGTRLCPALNYASALLALDSTSVSKVDVHQGSLSRYSIGPAIGIAGLPQDLPTSADLVRGPWSVCAANGTSTLVGGQAAGGTTLGLSRAVLATTAQGGDWVLWNGERLPIAGQVMQDLFGSGPVTVPSGWLDALPEGPRFAAPAISDEGAAITGPGGQPAQVGQVFTQSSPPRDFVLEANGKLATISPVLAHLFELTPGAPAATPITPSMAAADLSGASAVPGGGLPATLPAIVTASASPLCVTYTAGLGRSLTTGGTVPAGSAATSGAAGVDGVWLPPGHGALVGAAPSVQQPSAVTTWFLVTGAERFALPSRSVAAVLGYDLQTSGTVLPASVLDLLPEGPALDPAAATLRAAAS
jgi:type VII secretion protein EccB